MHTGPAGIVYKHLEKVTDLRAYRGPTHDLHEMILMALTATVCGRMDGLIMQDRNNRESLQRPRVFPPDRPTGGGAMMRY